MPTLLELMRPESALPLDEKIVLHTSGGNFETRSIYHAGQNTCIYRAVPVDSQGNPIDGEPEVLIKEIHIKGKLEPDGQLIQSVQDRLEGIWDSYLMQRDVLNPNRIGPSVLGFAVGPIYYTIDSNGGTFANHTRYIVMQEVAGETLFKVLERLLRCGDRLDPISALDFMDKLLQQMTVAHESRFSPIVHRDLKPGNIIVTPEDEPVILDWDLAMLDREIGEFTNNRLTVLGTPDFMAPEQFSNPDRKRGEPILYEERVSPESDQFQLALIAAALFGLPRELFLNENMPDPDNRLGSWAFQIWMYVSSEQHSIDLERELQKRNIRPAIVDIICKGVSPNKLDRFPSLRAMREAFARAREDLLISDAA